MLVESSTSSTTPSKMSAMQFRAGTMHGEEEARGSSIGGPPTLQQYRAVQTSPACFGVGSGNP